MSRNIENSSQPNPEEGKSGDRIGIPSQDDLMELGLALHLQDAAKLDALALKIGQEIVDSQKGDRAGGMEYTVTNVETRVDGKDIILKIFCQERTEPFEAKIRLQ